MILREATDIKEVLNPDNYEPSKIEAYLSDLGDWLVNKGFQLLIAIVFLFVGFKVSRMIVKMIKKSFDRSELEPSVSGFLQSLIKFSLYAIVFIMATSILGFQVTSLVTILGTASLAIGLALQGSLSNFAGGVLILILKPFKVGDYIVESNKSCEGTVVSIDIFYTRLRTIDNRLVIIPNGSIMDHAVINLTAEPTRKLDLAVGVSYDSNIKLVKDTLKEVGLQSEYCKDKNAVEVFVSELKESSISIGLRFWVDTDDYWPAKWDTTEKIKLAFDEKGIVIPFQQMEVTVKGDKKEI